MTKIIDEHNNHVFYKTDDDQYHREDGPAAMFATGCQMWYLNGKLHRADGPAIIYSDSSNEYYLNGIEYTEDAYKMIQFFNGVNVND